MQNLNFFFFNILMMMMMVPPLTPTKVWERRFIYKIIIIKQLNQISKQNELVFITDINFFTIDPMLCSDSNRENIRQKSSNSSTKRCRYQFICNCQPKDINCIWVKPTSSVIIHKVDTIPTRPFLPWSASKAQVQLSTSMWFIREPPPREVENISNSKIS